ncbi:MAG: hypothetical protein ACKO0W_10555 [Planctomycetota bacterium]
MSLSDSRARLNSAHRDLLIAWHRARESWHDDVARTFFERSIEPIDAQLRAAINALESMDEVLRRVHNECGDR